MQEFTFYTSADEQTLYRYQIRQCGRVFYVTMSLMDNDVETKQLGTKVLINIPRNEVIKECLSHCRRQSKHQTIIQRKALLTGVRNWLVCSMAMLTFIRLMIARS